MNETGSFKKLIIASCISCAVLGGIIGGLTAGFYVNRVYENRAAFQIQTKTSSTSETEAQKTDEASAVPEQSTVPETSKPVENNTQNIVSGTYTSSDDKPSGSKVYSAKEIYANNVESVVSIEVRSSYAVGYGTGFIISEDGYIVTNFHVVENAATCNVTLYDDSVYSAKVVGFEESNDIAVIKIEPKGEIHSLLYGNSSDLQVGDNIYVIGNPLGDLTFTLTDGVISALNRLIETDEGLPINMFQTNAAINSGNSGGPVFDEHGYVVGIASAKYASASIEGLSFCIPIDDVRSMIDEIINKGYVSGKPLLGISVCDREVTNYGFIQSSRSIGGVKIVAVGSNSAAASQGLLVGDIIIKANGEAVATVSALKTVLSEFRAGDTVKLEIKRNGTVVNISFVLDEYSPAPARTNYSYVYDI